MLGHARARMNIHRFHVPSVTDINERVQLPAEEATHATRVLRLRSGAMVAYLRWSGPGVPRPAERCETRGRVRADARRSRPSARSSGRDHAGSGSPQGKEARRCRERRDHAWGRCDPSLTVGEYRCSAGRGRATRRTHPLRADCRLVGQTIRSRRRTNGARTDAHDGLPPERG